MTMPIAEQVASEVSYAVAKKAQDVTKSQGDAAVEMIKDAARTSQAAAQTDSTRLLDVYA